MDGVPDVRQSIGAEIQAFVGSLVSALGGRGADEDGHYVLGDDALACLKDLRRWLRIYDEKTNRLDVARCMAAANLVKGDLLQILALWDQDVSENQLLWRIALATLELLVPLTWPLDKQDQQMTLNHHRHVPYLTEAQRSYKRSIISFEGVKILRTVVRVGLPSIALPPLERSSRDHGTIKLILYFLRNLVIISPAPSSYNSEEDYEVSRSATIEAFHYQDVFHLILAVSSGIGDDFDTEDVVVLELLFHLLKGIDPEKLFLSEKQLQSAKAEELQSLLRKEAGMLRTYARHAPTRHNRFGTMVWIKRDDEKFSTVSGQDILMDDSRGLAKMDQSKKWRKPGGRKGPQDVQNEVDLPVHISAPAAKRLRAFVGEFLDSAFNPFFQHLHKAIEREAERVLFAHQSQFFFLISWFLKAEQARRKATVASKNRHKQPDGEESPFAFVANALTQQVFITLNRFMQKSYDMHDWQELKAGMRCYTQILLTVQDMSESAIGEDQTIADNILSRLFYEETTHERIVAIVRHYSRQGFAYLDACTELAHVHLRVLEHYSRQNVEMQVRSRRRARKKKVPQTTSKGKDTAPNGEQAAQDASEAEEIAEAQRTTRERKFDFKRSVSKFMTQGCVHTFVALAKCYRDLTSEQLKRAHRFFYRVAFKHEMSVMLFRVDIIALFHKMIKGPESLDLKSGEGKEWSELVRQLFKKLTRCMEKRPELAVELLFSKISSTAYFLEHGYDIPVSKAKPRAPAELEVKPGIDLDRQIGIVVTVLLGQNQSNAVDWIKKTLSSAIGERETWEAEHALRHAVAQEGDSREQSKPDAPSIVVTPDTDERRKAMSKNNKLRLLMTLVGFQRLGIDDDADASWTIPSSIQSSKLLEALESIKRYETNPPEFEDGRTAEDLIRRKSTSRPRREADGVDDDDDEGTSDDDQDFLFPAGGPTAPQFDARTEPKQSGRRKRKDAGEELSDSERETRRKARQEANAKLQRRIKSDLYVHDSDEEDNEDRDREFFAKEEERRRAQGQLAVEALEAIVGEADNDEALVKGNRKRKSGGKAEKQESKRKRRKNFLESSDEAEDLVSLANDTSSPEPHTRDVDDETDTPITSPHQHSSFDIGATRKRAASLASLSGSGGRSPPGEKLPANDQATEEDGYDQPIARPARTRGLVIDSDSE